MICFLISLGLVGAGGETRRAGQRIIWLLLAAFASAAGAQSQGPFFWEAQKGEKTVHILGIFQPGVDWQDIPCSGEILSRLKGSDALFAGYSPELFNQAMEQVIREDESLPRRQTGFPGIISSTGLEFQRLSAESRKFLEEKYSYIQSIDGLGLEPRLENMNHAGFVSVLRYSCLAENGPLFERFAGEMGELEGAFVSFQQKLHSHGPVPGYLDEVEDIVEILRRENRDSRVYFTPSEPIDKMIKNYENNCSPKKAEAAFEKFKQVFFLWLEKYRSGGEIKQFEDIEKLKKSGFPDMIMASIESRFGKKPTKARNKKWAAKIIRASEIHDSVFIAADLIHFTGKSGVLNILEDSGFSAARFDSGCKAR